jgi:hypothetical protein
MCITSISLPKDTGQPLADSILPHLTGYEFSKDRISHYFCTTCGTHMMANVRPKTQIGSTSKWFVMCGTLEGAADWYLPSHEYVFDTTDGGFSDVPLSLNGVAIEKWAGHPGQTELLLINWRSLEAAQAHLEVGDRLHARCKCGGVSFWISRKLDMPKYPARICGCSPCRLATGMEWSVGAMAEIPISNLRLHGDGEKKPESNLVFGSVKTYESSPGIKRSFCGSCGATLFFQRTGERTVWVAVGLLDAVEGARAESWLDWNFNDLQFQDDAMARGNRLFQAVQEGFQVLQRGCNDTRE